jgi:hypothetical protein
MISEPMVCLAQTVHLSCTNTNTLSKWIETRFHMTHVTKEFHRVRPKQFLSLWYIRHKMCTYLAIRLALSPNGLKRESTWALSSSSCIRCVQMISKPMVCSTQTVHLSCSDTKCLRTDWNEFQHEPRRLRVPSSASKMIFEPMACSAQTVHLYCVKISTISK